MERLPPPYEDNEDRDFECPAGWAKWFMFAFVLAYLMGLKLQLAAVHDDVDLLTKVTKQIVYANCPR